MDPIGTISIDKIEINPAYEKVVFPVSALSDRAFEESIKKDGIREPLTLNENRILLDGHRRFRKAQKLGIKKVPVKFKSFGEKLDEKLYVIDANLQRRQLTEPQRILLGIEKLKIQKEFAKKRQKTLNNPKSSSSSNELKGQARDIVAKDIDVSPTTFQRGIYIAEHGDEKIKESWMKEKTSTTRAYNILHQKNKIFPDVTLPENKYNVIILDLPLKWNHEERGSATEHYKTYLPEEYKEKFPLEKMPFATDCIVFCWCWPAMEQEVRDIMENHYGFEPSRSQLVWVKRKDDKLQIGLGSKVRLAHELLLIYTRGEVRNPNTENRPPSVIIAERREHSEKPLESYLTVEKMFPNEKYLSMFDRYRKPLLQLSGNWVFWGNEANEKITDEKLSRDCTPEEDFEANCHSWSSPDRTTEKKPEKCPECGQLKTEFELNTYGRKCTDCYDMLRIMVKSNKGVMTAQLYQEFQEEYGSKRKKKK